MHREKLSDCFDVIVENIPSRVVHVCVMFDFGSRFDGVDQSGMTHFVEHMLFKGTKSRKYFQVLDSIEKYGADFNAYTTKEELCVHVSVSVEFVGEVIAVLGDIVCQSEFFDDEFLKERDVIFEEISSYEDSPSELILDVFEEYCFKNTSLSLPILGKISALEKLKSTDMNVFYYSKILSSPIVVSIVGGVDVEYVVELVRKNFERKIKIQFPDFYKESETSSFSFFNESLKRKTNQAHCVLGIKAPSWSDEKERCAVSLFTHVMGGGFSSSLLNLSLREKLGLAYTIDASYNPFSDIGLFQIYFAADKRKVKKCINEIQMVFDTCMHESFFDKNIKLYKNRLIGQLTLSNENKLNIAISNAKYFLVKKAFYSFSDAVRDINAVTSDELLSISRKIADVEKMSFLEFC